MHVGTNELKSTALFTSTASLFAAHIFLLSHSSFLFSSFLSVLYSFLDFSLYLSFFTKAFYEGSAALMDPRESWAAKWIRVDAYLPGVYAISITGTFDREIEEDLESRGIRWRCRPAPKD